MEKNLLEKIDQQNRTLRRDHISVHQEVKESLEALIDHNGGSILGDIYHEAVDDAEAKDKEITAFYASNKDQLHEIALREDIARAALKQLD